MVNTAQFSGIAAVVIRQDADVFFRAVIQNLLCRTQILLHQRLHHWGRDALNPLQRLLICLIKLLRICTALQEGFFLPQC